MAAIAGVHSKLVWRASPWMAITSGKNCQPMAATPPPSCFSMPSDWLRRWPRLHPHALQAGREAPEAGGRLKTATAAKMADVIFIRQFDGQIRDTRLLYNSMQQQIPASGTQPMSFCYLFALSFQSKITKYYLHIFKLLYTLLLSLPVIS